MLKCIIYVASIVETRSCTPSFAHCTSLITIYYYCIVDCAPTKNNIIFIKISILDPRATITNDDNDNNIINTTSTTLT